MSSSKQEGKLSSQVESKTMSHNIKTHTIGDIIEASPSNRFSTEIMIIASLQWFLPGTQMVLISNVTPYVQCEYALTNSMVAFSTSFFFFGMFTGAIYFGYIGDVCGRKFTTVCGTMLILYFGLLTSAITSIVFLSVARFLIGTSIACLYINAVALSIEYVKVNQRTTAILWMTLFNAAGSSYGYLMSYLILNSYGWRLLTIVLCLPGVPFLIAMYRVPESFKYLQLTNNRAKLMEILQCISNLNNVELPHSINMECKTSRNRASYVYVLKRYRLKTFLLVWVWIAGMLCFYGQSFLLTYRLQNHHCKQLTSTVPTTITPMYGEANITTKISHHHDRHCQVIQNSDHLFSFLISLAPLLGIFMLNALERIGRKRMMLLNFLIQLAVYVLQLVCLPYWLNLVLLLILMSTSCSFTSFAYLYTIELFPTVIRTTATGLVSSGAKLCMIAVPFLFQYLIYKSVAAVAWLIILFIIVAIVCLMFLEETYGKPLARE